MIDIPNKYIKFFNKKELSNFEITSVYEFPPQNICCAVVIPKNGTFDDSRLFLVDKKTNKGGFVDGQIALNIIDGSEKVWTNELIKE